MKITDKMIEDIMGIAHTNPDVETGEELKSRLKQKGYEVEEEKTALELYYEKENELYNILANYFTSTALSDLRKLYVNAIQEIQQKPKIDDDLIEWIRDSKNILTRNSPFGYSIEEKKEYFTRLLKQLGE
jgi:deoxyadenosine/deoxycytidine kinase